MKTIFQLLIILTVALLTVSNVSLLSQFSGGDGTVSNPYQIYDRKDWEEFVDSVHNSVLNDSNNNNNWSNWSRGKHFRLMKDIPDSVRVSVGKRVVIDDTILPFLPINCYHKSFQGHFHGGGHKITISIRNNDSLNPKEALFHFIFDAAIDSLDVDGYYAAEILSGSVGGIVSGAVGNISINYCNNYVVFDDIYKEYWDPFWGLRKVRNINAVGGIIGGYMYYPMNGLPIYGSLDLGYCNNYSNILAGYIYGIIYYCNSCFRSRIHNCNNYGNFEGNEDTTIQRAIIAGIAGEISNTTMYNCNNYGNLTTQNNSYTTVAGIVKSFGNADSIINCNNYGVIRNEYKGGPATGITFGNYSNPVYLSNCNNYGDMIGVNIQAGIIGVVPAYSELKDCNNYGNIIGSFNGNKDSPSAVAGIVWAVINDINYGGGTTINNCNNYGNITGNTRAGGIVGALISGDKINILNCKNTGDIIGNRGVGGIVGYVGYYDINTNNYDDNDSNIYLFAKISHCENSGNITGRRGIGGITGEHTYNNLEISYCINIGTVKGDTIVGGITGGYNYNNFKEKNGNIYNSINAGLVVGKDIVGGIIGRNRGEVKNCLNIGTVKGDSKVGCIVGENEGGTVSNCHYDKQMCIYGGINGADASSQAEGYLTKELIGNGLLSKLGTTDWTYRENLYPTLESFENDTVAMVAASPAYLCAENINDYDKYNNIRHHFEVSTANNVNWQSAFGNVNFSANDATINDATIINLFNDTLISGIGNYKKYIPVNFNDNKNCGINLPTTKFHIRASEHKLVDPNATNYRIPIYIKASEDVSDLTIEKLVIEFDRNNFYPQRVDNGTMQLDFIDNTAIEVVLEDVKIPSLEAEKESALLTVTGYAILGNKDSSGIIIKEVVFSDKLNVKSELIDGYITIDICREGGPRLLEIREYDPAVIVKNNPVMTDILEVQCRTVERGKHTLELIDLLGKTTLLEEFTAGENNNWIFDFDIPVQSYAIGSYLLVMKSPTSNVTGKRYITKFVLQK